MNVISFVILLVAATLFAVNAWLAKSIVALGLCLLTIGLIVEFAATSHTFTF
jgi:hypothetical protein